MTTFNSKYYGSRKEEVKAAITRLTNAAKNEATQLQTVVPNLPENAKAGFTAFVMANIENLNAEIAKLTIELNTL